MSDSTSYQGKSSGDINNSTTALTKQIAADTNFTDQEKAAFIKANLAGSTQLGFDSSNTATTSAQDQAALKQKKLIEDAQASFAKASSDRSALLATNRAAIAAQLQAAINTPGLKQTTNLTALTSGGAGGGVPSLTGGLYGS